MKCITYYILFTCLVTTLNAQDSAKPLPVKIDAFSQRPSKQTKLLESIIQQAKENHQSENFGQAITLYQEALLISENLPERPHLQSLFLEIGRNYYSMSNYDLAQQYLFNYIKLNKESKNLEEEGTANSLIASTYYNLGDYNLAHEYKLKSIEIKNLLQDTTGIASDYYDLGSMFFYQNMYEQALTYYNKSKKLAHQVKAMQLVYNCTAALGATYERKKELKKSLEYNLRSLEIADSLNYKTGQAYALHNIGSNYIQTKEFAKAQAYLEQSLNIKKEVNDKWGQVGSYMALGDLSVYKNDLEQAEVFIKNALAIAESLNSKVRISDIYRNLSNLYQIAQKKDLTIEYLNKYVSMRDTIMNEATLREMGDRNTQFEVQKKEHEIALLKKDNQLLETSQKVQRLNIISAGLMAGFLLLLCLFLYYLFNKQRNYSALLATKNEEIEQQKSKIEQQNQKLATTNKALEVSNKDLQQFAYVASHDLIEPLRMIKSYGQLINRRYKKQLDDAGQEFLHYMTDAAVRMDKMLIELLEYARTSKNPAQKEKINTKEILTSIRTMLSTALSEKNAILNVKDENLPAVMGQQTQIYQLFQNLITNGIKYQKNQQPIITVDCVKNCKNYIFSVADNGIGIAEENQQRIFEMFQRLHSKQEFEGTGIGLATCKKIVNLHQGDIWVESKIGEGSKFFFTLPIPENAMNEPSIPEDPTTTVQV